MHIKIKQRNLSDCRLSYELRLRNDSKPCFPSWLLFPAFTEAINLNSVNNVKYSNSAEYPGSFLNSVHKKNCRVYTE